MILKAPFVWFGGKSRVADIIWDRFGNVPNFVEPFFGSGAVLLGRPHDPGIETVNDKDGFVCNAWRAIQAAPEETAKWADWPVNECLPAGTMIATPAGEIPVEDIQSGMVVLGERGGEIVPTQVFAVQQNKGDEFYGIGRLLATGNHPVWTLEHGYIPARDLMVRMHVKKLHYPVYKKDLFMLQYTHEQQGVGSLRAERSAHTASEIHRRYLSQKSTLAGTSVAGYDGRQNTSGLLDSVSDSPWLTTSVRGDRTGTGRRLAGSRARMDCSVPLAGRFSQSDRWRRRMPRLRPDSGLASEVGSHASGRTICAGTVLSNARQEAHTRSNREDSRCQQRQENASQYETEIVCIAQEESPFKRTTRQDASGQPDHETNVGIQAESYHPTSRQANSLRRDGTNVFLNSGRCTCAGCYPWRDSICSRTSNPLQRIYTPTTVAVYNFQTTTGNYFANRILVHNCDLQARHVWLRARREELSRRLEADPDYFDAKIAGWWLWGIACWIGGGWCDPNTVGPWVVQDGQLVHLGNAGRGVNRQRVHLGNAGQGVNRQRVHLGDAGRGVNRQRVHLGDAGRGLREWFQALQNRLRHVRVCCGDWSRVCGPTPTFLQGLTGVFLDPPYSEDAGRDKNIYASEDLTVAHDVREWAITNGDNPLLRIGLCGYEGEYIMPNSWECFAWKTSGGYSNRGQTAGRENAHRERIWFSPHCLKPEQPGLFAREHMELAKLSEAYQDGHPDRRGIEDWIMEECIKSAQGDEDNGG